MNILLIFNAIRSAFHKEKVVSKRKKFQPTKRADGNFTTDDPYWLLSPEQREAYDKEVEQKTSNNKR